MKVPELVAFLSDPERLWALPGGYVAKYLALAEAYDGPTLEARAPGSAMRAEGNVAVLSVSGPIDYRPSFFSALFGGAAVTTLQSDFRAAMADPGVKAIVLAFDSPGGSVHGIQEFAGEILAAKGTKPIVSQIITMGGSAASWLASMADSVTMMASGVTGALGVITGHADLSAALEKEGVKMTVLSAGEFKAEGSPYLPLSAAAEAAIQVRLEAMYAQQTKDVAAGRRVTQTYARENFGGGRVLNAQQALKSGLVDSIGTLEQTIGRLSGRKASGSMKAEQLAAPHVFTPDAALAGHCECERSYLDALHLKAEGEPVELGDKLEEATIDELVASFERRRLL